MRIRPAGSQDLDVVIDLGLRFNRASIYSEITPATEADMARLAGWLLEHGTILLLEAAPPVRPLPEVVGLLGGAIIPNHVNLSLFAHEFAWWVDEDARGHGWTLVEAFEAWALEAGAAAVVLVAPHGTQRAALERVYARKGYAMQETTWWKPLGARRAA